MSTALEITLRAVGGGVGIGLIVWVFVALAREQLYHERVRRRVAALRRLRLKRELRFDSHGMPWGDWPERPDRSRRC